MNWNWKNQIYVIDDIISLEQQETIKNYLFDGRLPWYYAADITDSKSQKDNPRPAMKHFWISKGQQVSSAPTDALRPIVENCLKTLFKQTQQKANYAVDNCRSFLQFPLNNLKGSAYDAHHVDSFEEHLVFLYYVMDSDGDTVIFDNPFSFENTERPSENMLTEKLRVSPKQGRVVIFDGFYWHTATQPRHNMRCVVNFNVHCK